MFSFSFDVSIIFNTALSLRHSAMYFVRVYAASGLISWSIELTAVAGRQLAPACPLLHAHFADIPWERAPRAAEDARGAPWGTYSNVVV